MFVVGSMEGIMMKSNMQTFMAAGLIVVAVSSAYLLLLAVMYISDGILGIDMRAYGFWKVRTHDIIRWIIGAFIYKYLWK